LNGKYYAQYLLRALDGEDLRLDRELGELVELGGRVRAALPDIPGLDEMARRRIWNSIASEEREPAVLPRRGGILPRLAWAGAAVMALAVIAVLLVVFLSTGGPTVVQPEEIASLHLDRGVVTIRSAQGEEREAGASEVINEGDVVMAADDARGIVEFASGCILRLHGEAEIGLYAGEDGVVAEIFKGKSYHRVVDGTPYSARSGDVTVSARGTAFTFDVEARSGKVISLHSSVQVSVDSEDPSDWTSRLEEGDVFIYGEDTENQVLDLMREELDNEWLRWNRSLDEALGLPVGAFSLLDEAAVTEEPEQPEQPQTPEEQEEEGEQPAPAPQPAPQPEPVVESSLTLSGSPRQGAVDFSWTLTGYTGFQGFKLCRSESNPAPSYPGDWWMYIDGAGTRSATDASVQAGQTYYYRLAVYNAGMVLGYSNTVQVTVPGAPQELSIALSAVVESGKIKLSWSVSGEGDYSGFKVCRSETNTSPSYPGDTCTFVDAAQRSYNDATATSGHTYYFRVGIYKDGTIIKYSNSVKATLP
jgi:hypothetical protein